MNVFQEFMEHSISQLMVDDEDGDPAIVHSKPIPKVVRTDSVRKRNLTMS